MINDKSLHFYFSLQQFYFYVKYKQDFCRLAQRLAADSYF